MRKLLLVGISMLMLFGALVLFGQRVSAQSPTPTPPPQVEVRGDAKRIVNSAAPDTITSLPMSNPYCFQPDFSIDGKLRYRSNAFFENYVTYSYDMIPGGIKVTCGLPNEGGFGALYGKGYTVDVKAYDVTNAWVLDDQLLVKCPAYNP
jgi:hypothetical protein